MYLIKKYGAAVLAFVMVLGVCLLFCTRKTGMFIDEVYSYGLANSYYAPFLPDLKEGSFTDQVFTREEIESYLSVGEGDAFAAGSVYYNQTKDVHPPLYYWVMNAVSSVFRGSCSKWIGLGINLFFFLLTLTVLFALSMELFGSSDVAAAVVALYGMSVLGLSTVMMIRMYMMLTFFTAVLALLTAKLMHNPKKAILFPLIMLTIFCGMMTQYYFVFYAFFLCLLFDIRALVKKDFRTFVLFSLHALVGVGLMLLVFPASLHQLFEGNGQVVGGHNISDAISDISGYKDRLSAFFQARRMMKGVSWTALGAVLCCVPMAKQLIRASKENRIRYDALFILVPALPAFLAVAILSPVQEYRYLYNLVPVFVLGAGFLLHAAETSSDGLPHFQVIRKAAFLLIVFAALWNAKTMPPDYLFPEQAEYDSVVGQYSDLPCVYLTDGFFAPVTQDLMQLRRFDDFIVASYSGSSALHDYLEGQTQAVLYIDTNPFWSSGFSAEHTLEEMARDTGFTESRLLYRYNYEDTGGLSETYLVWKP